MAAPANNLGGILSDEITFYTSDTEWSSGTTPSGSAIKTAATDLVKQLQTIPSLGGSKDKLDVTCLEHTSKQYMNGLTDYGDSLDFKFLYDNGTDGNYTFLDGLDEDKQYPFSIHFKDGESFNFIGKPSVALDDVAVNNAITFTLSVAIQSEIFYIARTE